MLAFWRKNKNTERLGDDIKSSRIDDIVADILNNNDTDLCLDIGTGHDSAAKFTTVDMDTSCNPDIVGDIRCLFAASDHYRNMKLNYKALEKIRGSHYALVRLKHIVEHIEWIYHQGLFEWIYGITAPGGAVVIDTPNLDYIVKMYYRASAMADEQTPFKFPSHEYAGLKNGSPVDLVKWVQFKLFSGCSPGDFHHACLNRRLLFHYLSEVGFEPIGICDDSTLRAIAYKPIKTGDDLDSKIDKYLQGG